VASFERDGRYLFALADGLGGHGGGDVASELVVTKSLEVFEDAPPKDCLALCFTKAQDALMEEQRKRGAGAKMKTTLVLFNIEPDRVGWGHIGDSRLYVFHSCRVVIRTSDHSVPQMLVSTGEITEKEIRSHPDRNRLLRVMGVEWDNPRYQLAGEFPLIAGTSYLLCTDGFWELIDEKEMCRDLKLAETPEEWLNLMEKKVLKNGKGKNMDNYSAIAVFIR